MRARTGGHTAAAAKGGQDWRRVGETVTFVVDERLGRTARDGPRATRRDAHRAQFRMTGVREWVVAHLLWPG